MNKRKRKKLENKLLLAIEELNNDVAKNKGLPPITSEEILSKYIEIRKTKAAINRTLKDYKLYKLKSKRIKKV